MRTVRTLLALSLAAGCAAQVPGEEKGELADPSFDDPAADVYSRLLDYRGPIAFGETLDGTYSLTGYTGYSFAARAGAHVSLALDGAGNDPVLYVYGPKLGDTWAYIQRVDMNDDYYGLDSFLDLTLPADGTYLVVTREYWGDPGAFALTLSCADAECAPASGERSCGTRGAPACFAGEFCNYPESASCGSADHPGRCETIPTLCTREVAPVCGCNNWTYNNACSAHAAGVSVASQGACAPSPSDCRTTGCGYGRSCDYCSARWQCVPAGSQC